MAELAVHQPSQLMKIGALIFLLGMIIYLLSTIPTHRLFSSCMTIWIMLVILVPWLYLGKSFLDERELLATYLVRFILLGWFIGELLTLHLLSFL